MEDLIEMLTYIVGTIATGIVSAYGAAALDAIRQRAKTEATKRFIDILDHTLENAVGHARSKGLDQKSADWVIDALDYTKKSIPESLKREHVSDEALTNRIKAKQAEMELYQKLNQSDPLQGRLL